MFRLNTISMAVMASLYLNTALAVPNNALPTGGQVTQGQAQIQQSMSQMQIQQQSQKAVIDWNSFNIGQQASVTFQQPNAQAATLNRVLNGSSEIAGQLNANGQVYLLNPNGVLFSPTAQVNTSSLVVSTATLSDQEFLQGQGTLQHSIQGKIVNQGNLTAAQGGQIVLSSRQIDNMGTIQADQGQVQLLAGQSTRVNITADGLIQTELQAGQTSGAIQNSGKISATGGQLDLFASGTDSHIQHTGIAEAQSILNKEGKIYLVAGYEGQSIAPKTGKTVVDGVLDASAPNGGHGGFIETSAAQVKITDQAKVTTKATQGNTGTWLIDPTDFTIAAGNDAKTVSGIGATTLENNLNNTSVAILTSSTGTEQGDIYVNAPVSWAANELTLTAHNDIHVNAEMNVSGGGTLALNTGTNGTVKMAMGENGFTGKVNFQQVGDNLLTINGQGYRVINDLGLEGSMTNTDLQGIWGTNYLGHYALGKDIDAAATLTWNNGTGFNPLYLNGQYFNGLGHTVDNLSINRPTDGTIGLIGTNEGGNISNIGLRNANIRGEAIVGGLVGSNVGLIENSFVSGIIEGQSSIGGIVGSNTIGNLVPIRGIINNSYSTARVEGSSYIGGLVGYNATDIYNSFATGLVEGNSNIGGLAGYNNGEIRNTYAIGQVGGNANIGGLVGQNFDGEIVNSYATGQVIGTTNIGGLVGLNDGQVSSITNSYWNTETTGRNNAVGLENGSTIATGLTTTQMQQAASFSNWGTDIDAQGGTDATWRIYEGHTTPLLRSFLRPVIVTVNALPNNNITQVYNGNVQVGNFSPIYSYSDLSAQGKLFENNATISASGRNVGSYMATFSQDLYSDNQLGYDVSVVNNTSNNPNTLKITPATLTLNAVADSKVYDGTTISAGIVNITGVQTGDTVTATQEFDSKNAGTRTLNVINPIINDGNGGDNYNVTVSQAVNQGEITPRFLMGTVDVNGFIREYDGTTNINSNFGLENQVIGDDIGISGYIGFQDKNVGTAKPIVFDYILFGNDVANYQFISAMMQAAVADIGVANRITPKAIDVTGITANDRVYDGTRNATLNTGNAQYTGMISGDNLTVANAVGQFQDKNAGQNKAVDITAIALGGTDAANYNLLSNTASTTANISKANIQNVSGITVNDRVYDGTRNATLNTGNAQYTGMISGDNLTVANAVGQFQDKNAGQNKAVDITAIALGGKDAVNYNLLSNTASTTANISKASATVTGNSLSTVYNGQNQNVNGFTATGLVSGEIEAVLTGVTATGATARNAGIYRNTVSGTDQNYDLTLVNGALQINQAILQNVTGITANDKTYDGTTDATLNTNAAQFNSMVAGDDLNVATASGQFKNKDIGTNKIVTITGIRLGGADASNYRLSNNTAMTTANINPENIQVSCDVLGTCPLPPSPPVSPVCEDCGTNEPLLVATVAECDSKDIEEVAKNCILKPKIVIQTEEQPRDDDGTPATPIQTKRALIIANGTYTDQHIAKLSGVYEDQKAVEQMLKAQGYTTTAVVDGTREQMITALNQLIKDSGEDDSVLIYYAGHGTVQSQSSVGYWFPVDASLKRKNGKRPETTWMSSIDVANFISGIKAKQILLVSDSCFSGSLSYETALQREPELPSNAVLKRRSVMVMTSGSEELVQDRDKYANNGLSPFANAFIAQLNKMDTEKELRGQNAYKFIYQGVTSRYQQYPTYGALPSARHNAGGEYLFLK